MYLLSLSIRRTTSRKIEIRHMYFPPESATSVNGIFKYIRIPVYLNKIIIS